jgi:hypothetical protein
MPGIDEYTKLLLHGDATPIVDSSLTPKTITVVGGATVNTTNKVFGDGSLYFDGAGDSLSLAHSTDWNFGTGDWTIDFWIRRTANNSAYDGIITGRYVNTGWGICYNGTAGSNKLGFYADFGSGIGSQLSVSNGALPLNIFVHIALVRYGNIISSYQDGILVASRSDISGININSGNKGLAIARSLVNNTSIYDSACNLDEIRVSKGIARWTGEFTPPSSPYDESNPIIEAESIFLTENLKTVETINTYYSETVILSEYIELKEATTIILTDNNLLLTGENLETKEFLTKSEYLNIQETVNISQSLEKVSFNEQLYFSENSLIFNEINLTSASKIISYNPLVIVTYTDPVQIAKINITDPENPTWDIYTINAPGEDIQKAKDIVYNSIFNYLYVACSDGKILKININDFYDREEINTVDGDNFKTIDSLDSFDIIYASTDQTNGELIVLDNSDRSLLNTDLRLLSNYIYTLDTRIDFINAFILNTDLRLLTQTKSVLNTDLRLLTHSYIELPANCINQTECGVYLDDILLTDVDMDSVEIIHTVDSETKCIFNLLRHHDNINLTLEGVVSQISNHNEIKILIKNNQEFLGNITKIITDSETNIIQVTATMTEKSDNRQTISLSMTTINTPLYPFDIILHQPDINNPEININSDNPEYYLGIKIPMGEKITQKTVSYRVPDYLLMGSTIGKNAYNLMNGSFKFDSGWNYFWLGISAINYFNARELYDYYVGMELNSFTSDAWFLTWATYIKQRDFEDITLKLGDGKVYINDLSDIDDEFIYIFNKLVTNKFIDTEGNILTKFKETFEASEINLGLTNTLNQKVYDYMNNQLGYFVGEAPFSEISIPNGIFVPAKRYVDKSNGLYVEKESSYNYTNYIKKIADLEYIKLQNINGTVLPKTRATIDLMLDAYYFYNISLLTRINVVNTNSETIYKNSNGFPVSVKSITINLGRMLVTLECDNSWSNKELEELNKQYPIEEDYQSKAYSIKTKSKYNPNIYMNRYWESE